ncbi:WD40-repeat-containing domain protein [Fusarium oxysporum]|nr:WD40-repeat-containing domain protein [Fusarium oxysporum]
MKTRLKSVDLYTIGWIAALPIERAAATALLHDRHDDPEGFDRHRSDENSYTWGRIGQHNLVIASLPAGVYGIAAAATTASNLIHSLPHIRIGLLVGIGGGIAQPDEGQDIRLGDIVVSQPDGTTGGVIQYDLGKATANSGWERKGSLDKPPPVLLHALASLQAEHEIEPSKVPGLLQAMWEAKPSMKRPKSDYTYQGAENDRLFESQHNHVGGSNCDKCDSSWEVKRDRRKSTEPEIHYGVIASGNTLIKDAATRGSLLEDTGHQCLCVEMEAAGLMDRFPCLVIRGICDYADSHKNDRWQRYAAATAAAFAVELLEYVPVGQLEATQKVIEAIQSFELKLDNLSVPIQNVDYRTALDQLSIAEGASFDSHAQEHSPTCLLGTRVELLKDINRWVDDQNSKTIFWLNGMAGTGKSTISRSVAQMRHKYGDLGASFFFKRGEPDQGNLAKFVPTLARQLAWSIPEVASVIKSVIDADPAIIGRTVREQFIKLVWEPVSKVAAIQTTLLSVVIVIDALDECERDDDIKLLLDLLSNIRSTTSLRARVLVTSRPDMPVRLGFRAIDGTYQNMELHRIPQSIVEFDISVFLHHEFAKIREKFNMLAEEGLELPVHWPGEANLMKLTMAASPLFIFAATLCRFIGDSHLGSPDGLLQEVLCSTNSGHASTGRDHASKLDMTYSPVLKQQVINRSGRERCDIVESFRLVVGTIITLASPLSMRALALLLDADVNKVTTRLRVLHSVLEVPRSLDLPVRLLHQSFHDYLVNPENKETLEFWVDEKLTHRNLARHCLRLMRGTLHENICGLSFPGMRRSTVDSARLEERMPAELQYACMYWVPHQTKVDFEPNDSNEVYDFLTTHFLHWMEALSLMARAGEGLDSIRSLVGWLKNRGDSSLSDFLADAVRFLQTNFSVINEAPLQIYSSALAFAPNRSITRRIFEHRIPEWLTVGPQVREDWDACLLTLEGHSNRIRSAVFSHDSTMVASASDDMTVRIWDVKTGRCEHVLAGHSGGVNSVVFSHDSTMVASASWDWTVRIWDAKTGKCEHVLEGHSSVNSVVFSHDSMMVASASSDKMIRIWDAKMGKCERVLEGHSNWIRSAVFSHDSTMVASASFDRTVRIWDVKTGKCENVLAGHSGDVNSVVFSHDSMMVASGFRDGTVRIWDVKTGKCENVLAGHSSSVNSVVFSHDSMMVASASSDKMIRIWDAKMGKCERVLEGHGDIVWSVVFSHDSTMVASASFDRTVRIWDAKMGKCEHVLESHSDQVISVVFSHDSTMVASASFDRTVRIWNVKTGKCEYVLEGHSGSIYSMVFSLDSTMVASGSRDETVRIWDVKTGKCEYVLEGHGDSLISVVFSHDSTMVASASSDETVRIWDAKMGKCERVLEGHGDIVWSVVFSHDSTMVASASFDRTVRIWNVKTGKCEYVLEGHSGSIYSVMFSHDSTMVASASDDMTVRIWDAKTGKCEYVLEGHSDEVRSVVFSHDSTMVASASFDRTVRIWTAETGECKEVIPLGSYADELSPMSEECGIVTGNGVFPFTFDRVSSADHSMLWKPSMVSTVGLQDKTWVKTAGKNLLWLPTECRDGIATISADTVVIGCQTGRVIVLSFSAVEMAKL